MTNSTNVHPDHIDWTEMSKVLRAGLTEAANLGYGTRVLPYSEKAPWPPKQCKQPAVMGETFVRKNEMETRPAEIVRSLGEGEVKQLVAGTGVGKTTKMPLGIVNALGTAGIVLCHDPLKPEVDRKYVYGAREEWGYSVNVEILTESVIERPSTDPTVYYAAASDFLGWLARYPDIVSRLSLDFIFLDESHKGNPEYRVFRYLATLKVLAPARIFYGTATGSGDLAMEHEGPGREMVTRPQADFNISNTDNVSSRCVLHASKIINKTLIFLPDDETCRRWYHYYERHDVPAIVFGYGTSSTVFAQMEQFLEENSACVILTTSRLDSSYTLDVDTVLCSGMTTRMELDFRGRLVRLRRDTVTKRERIQRAGRVGRFKKGKVVAAEVRFSEYSSDDDALVNLYVYLWSVVLCLRINNPEVSQFAEVGSLTRHAAAMLLHSKLPAYMVLPYMANDGVYAGFARGMKRVLFSNAVHESGETNHDKAHTWPERSTGQVDYCSVPITYKALVTGPQLWMHALCYAWLGYNHDNVHDFTKSEVQTVISSTRKSKHQSKEYPVRRATYTDSVSLSRSRPSSKTITQNRYEESPPPLYKQVGPSRRTFVPELEPLDIPPPVPEKDFDSARIMEWAGSVRREAPTVLSSQPSYRPPEYHKKSASYDDRWIRDRAAEKQQTYWEEDFPTRKKPQPVQDVVPTTRKFSRRESSSSGSMEPIELKRVDPLKYINYKLYPENTDLYKSYMESEGVVQRDWDRYYDLVRMKRTIATLQRGDVSGGSRDRYFLSVLRVHNSSVLSKMQSKASVSPTAVQKLFGTTQHKDYAELVMVSAQLLATFTLESYYVCVDKRAHQSGSSVPISPDSDDSARRGAYYLAVGNARLKVVVDILKLQARPLVGEHKRVVACAWASGDKIVSVNHAFGEETDYSHGVEVVRSSSELDLVLLRARESTIGFMPISTPTNDTEVLVIAHDVLEGTLQVHGPCRLVGGEGVWFIDQSFDFGFSGALVVDAKSCTVVALYVGLSHEDHSGSYGRVTPLSTFVADGLKQIE